MRQHLNAKQLRRQAVDPELKKKIKRTPITLILENVLDTYNIGSFFRLADAIAAEKIYLVGRTVTPPNLKIHRASVGTWRWVPWQQSRRIKPVLLELKKKNYQLIAVEQSKKSHWYWQIKPQFPIALLLGNEGHGLSREAMALADAVAELPMVGINHSLNVYAAAATVSYYFYRLYSRH